MSEVDWNDHATCPYCGHVEADSWEIDFGTNGSAEVTCSACDKDYHCQQHVTVNYSSSRKGGAK